MMKQGYPSSPIDSPDRSDINQQEDSPTHNDFLQQHNPHGMPYNPYQALLPHQVQSQQQPINVNHHHPQQQQQFYYHDPFLTSRCTLRQQQPILSPTSPSKSCRPKEQTIYGMPQTQQPPQQQQRRAQWGTPQPVSDICFNLFE